MIDGKQERVWADKAGRHRLGYGAKAVIAEALIQASYFDKALNGSMLHFR